MTNTSFQGHVISSFVHLNEADYYYSHLKNLGYTDDEISVFVSESTRDTFNDTDLDISSSTTQAAGEGSMIGGSIGAIVGLLLGLGSNAIIPGLGVAITGPLLGALMGAGAGGAAGGLVGALVGLGVDDDYAKKFEEDIKKGNIVIAVDPKPGHHEKIKEIAQENKVNNLYYPH